MRRTPKKLFALRAGKIRVLIGYLSYLTNQPETTDEKLAKAIEMECEEAGIVPDELLTFAERIAEMRKYFQNAD